MTLYLSLYRCIHPGNKSEGNVQGEMSKYPMAIAVHVHLSSLHDVNTKILTGLPPTSFPSLKAFSFHGG